ncbi:PTS sugar transporter subunit IIA [Cohnella cellulosilytica]|uniref:Mannitol-specific phosphotransferase enzyme IIA component n=1 Tax=Cohnella cellulosilytica TaxID=986710 RepID=A0ABW2FM68_9BACL
MTILSKEKIRLGVRAGDRYEAIRLVGQLLVDAGHVPAEYIDYMIRREEELSTFMGAGLAIPHGTNEAKPLIRSTGLAVLLSPDGIDFGEGQTANIVVGIAAVGDDHMELLTGIASIVADDAANERLLRAKSADEVLDIFQAEIGS